jgi:hypothetical protein
VDVKGQALESVSFGAPPRVPGISAAVGRTVGYVCIRTVREPWARVGTIPLTVFDTKGIPAKRCESIERAVESGGKHVATLHEAWIEADPFRVGFKVFITGPHGFERTVVCALDDAPALISERVRETLDD